MYLILSLDHHQSSTFNRYHLEIISSESFYYDTLKYLLYLCFISILFLVLVIVRIVIRWLSFQTGITCYRFRFASNYGVKWVLSISLYLCTLKKILRKYDDNFHFLKTHFPDFLSKFGNSTPPNPHHYKPGIEPTVVECYDKKNSCVQQ